MESDDNIKSGDNSKSLEQQGQGQNSQPGQNPYMQPGYVGVMGPGGQFAFLIPPYGMPPPPPTPMFYPFFINSAHPPPPLGYPPPPMMNYPPNPPAKSSEPQDLKAIEDFIHSLLKKKEEGDETVDQLNAQMEQTSISEEPVEIKPQEPVENAQAKRLQERKWIKKGHGEQSIDPSVLFGTSLPSSSSTSLLSSSPPSSSSSLFSTNLNSNLPPAATEKKANTPQRMGFKTHSKNSNRKNPLVVPKNLEHISESMVQVYQTLRPSPNEFSKRLKLLSKLQNIVNSIWADANPHLNLFGSSANEFGFRHSDMDICLSVGPQAGTTHQIVTKLGNVLSKRGMKRITTLPRARVPIVKFEDPQTRFSCDICFNNQLALHNTRLIADYSKIDIRFKHLGYIVKYWAKQRQINEPYHGTLSSYAYLLMVINFLQQRKPPVLPPLQQMRDPADENVHLEVDGYDCYYYNKIDRLKDFGAANKETPGELLAAFFRLYSSEFDWEHAVVSPRTGGYLTKAEKGWTRTFEEKTREYYYFTLEDPFELTHNLGRVVDRENLKVMKYEFRRAFRLICNNEDLKTICKKYEEGESPDFI